MTALSGLPRHGIGDPIARRALALRGPAVTSVDATKGAQVPDREDAIEEWAAQLAEVSGRRYANESELRHNLAIVLQPFCVEVLEMRSTDIRHEGVGQSGRFDSLFGRVVIEYKTPGRLDSEANRRADAEQTVAYLRDQEVGADVAMITDGRTWAILRDTNAEPEPGEQTWLVFDDVVPQTPLEQFSWRANSPDTARRVLELFGNMRSAPVTSDTLISKLHLESDEPARLLMELAHALGSRTVGSRSDILFGQWVALAGVSYGIDDSNQAWPEDSVQVLGEGRAASILSEAQYSSAIFLLHSYIALASKLIAAEVLALSLGHHDDRPSQWRGLPSREFSQKFIDVENGSLAARLRAPGLMGADLFGWYAPILADNRSLERALRDLLNAFAELAWARLAHTSVATTDLLREFYAAVVPRGLRRALGEFFTPRWIAERVVSSAIAQQSADEAARLRFLDPTCGSGTFLVVCLRRALRAAALRGLPESEQVAEAIETVHGFDINPVSPLMARVNLLLALGDRVEHLPEVRFHVYEADSLLLPEVAQGQGTLDRPADALQLPLVIGSIDLPQALGTLEGISSLARLIEGSLANGRSAEGFSRRLRPELSRLRVPREEMEDVTQAATDIYSRVQKLHDDGKDGIWASVMEQAFAPLTAGTFDVVVGNPPWISWRNLPSAWKERSERLWRRYGLWQGRSFGQTGTPFSDISTLMLARSVDTYAPEGVVALLMPDSVLLADPGGRGLRRCVLGPYGNEAPIPVGASSQIGREFRPLQVDDFSALNPFPDAATKPVALYVRSSECPVFPIPGELWTRGSSRTPLTTRMPWREAGSKLHGSPFHISPLDLQDRASRWRPEAKTGDAPLRGRNQVSGYTWGEGFNSRGADGILTVEILSGAPDPRGLVRIRTCHQLGRKTRRRPEREAVVEAAPLWPLVRGRDIHPFSLTRSDNFYVIVLHGEDNLEKTLTVGDVISRFPRLYDFLEPDIEELQGRRPYGSFRPSPDRPWGMQGNWHHIGPGSHLVLSRYMHPRKMPPFSVAPSLLDRRVGRTVTALPNTKANFLSLRSEDEAHYVAGVMNSASVQATIARQASSTAISPAILSSIAVPRFDPQSDLHIEISRAAREARAPGRNVDISTYLAELVGPLWA